MGMRISGGGSAAPVASQSTVAQWQQSAQLALLQKAAPQPPVAPKPTETLGNNVNTFA